MMSLKPQSKFSFTMTGFTLIEMMIVVVIISILAAIAIPSYRHYAVLNAESDTKASMKKIQLDLDRWRASALTYRGFYPKNVDSSGNIVYQYNNTDNTLIYLPLGSTATNYRYAVTLVDGVDTTKSLTDTGVNSSTGRTWRMLAVPKNSGITKDANRILLTSTGLQCESKYSGSSGLEINSTSCGTGGISW